MLVTQVKALQPGQRLPGVSFQGWRDASSVPRTEVPAGAPVPAFLGAFYLFELSLATGLAEVLHFLEKKTGRG